MTGTFGESSSYLDWLPTTDHVDTAAPALSDVPAGPGKSRVAGGPAAADNGVGPVIVVAGAHGGSGASVVAVLLALVTDTTTLVLDGTPVGGDIVHRAPAAHATVTWATWLTGERPVPAGWSVLGRDRRAAATPAHLADAVTAARSAVGEAGVVIVDTGACIGSTWFDAVADLADYIVVTIDDRPGAANAARPVLTELRGRLGTAGMGRSVQLVVASQRLGVDHVTGPLADALTGRVAAVHHLPYDAELAAGIGIDPAELSAAAYATASAVLSAFRAPLHREAHRP
ncbi:hypothetical protein [Rhodococcus sp. SORGH_AS_0301]|uniref:hypothetical protein n=1 Tax=Rhodococcus sp. SORGH_AS_0301 TaxID=3041780 RepID=UPI00278563C9|nr:hypothetical protein [Rhodococcus sp. SORGH_AS_0301]MDQ1178638.1 MinD-like ATPase involved in chromosome partitioning or flagellar assembly [Rhodococcus sp. SORGH_AS_0301]